MAQAFSVPWDTFFNALESYYARLQPPVSIGHYKSSIKKVIGRSDAPSSGNAFRCHTVVRSTQVAVRRRGRQGSGDESLDCSGVGNITTWEFQNFLNWFRPLNEAAIRVQARAPRPSHRDPHCNMPTGSDEGLSP